MNKDNGGAAFPLQITAPSGKGGTITMDQPHHKMQHGMTLRDYFAANLEDILNDDEDFHMSIKVALVGRPCPSWQDNPIECLQWNADWLAAWRGMRADAMLKERKK